MRKLGLLISSCIAVVALTAFSAPAFGATRIDDRCDLDHPEWGDGVPGPYDNSVALHDLKIEFNSPFEHKVSGYSGGALACGTQISDGLVGVGTLNDNARVAAAPGEETNSTDPVGGIPLTSYVGDGELHVASFTGFSAGSTTALILPQTFTLRTDALSECERENGLLAGGPEPGTVTACYKGNTTGRIPGHNWNFVVQQGDTFTTVIGPFYNDLPQKWPAGLTSIEAFTLCDYAGATGDYGTTGSCGSPSANKWLHKNGDATKLPQPVSAGSVVYVDAPYKLSDYDHPARPARPACGDGNGVITATVTNKDDVTSAPARICVAWSKGPFAVPHP